MSKPTDDLADGIDELWVKLDALIRYKNPVARLRAFIRALEEFGFARINAVIDSSAVSDPVRELLSDLRTRMVILIELKGELNSMDDSFAESLLGWHEELMKGLARALQKAAA